MQKHYKAILLGLVLAIGAFVVSLQIGDYMATYAVVVSAFVFGMAYLIAVASFKDRPDPEGRGTAGRH
jgi:hypothetical protein